MRFAHVLPASLGLLGVLGLPGGACGTPEVKIEPAVLRFHGEDAQVQLPAAARLGAPVPLRVRTFGGGCTRPAGMRQEVRGLRAQVMPMDSTALSGPTRDCPAILVYYTRWDTLRFQQRGRAVVRVLGRREPGGGHVVVERSLAIE